MHSQSSGLRMSCLFRLALLWIVDCWMLRICEHNSSLLSFLKGAINPAGILGGLKLLWISYHELQLQFSYSCFLFIHLFISYIYYFIIICTQVTVQHIVAAKISLTWGCGCNYTTFSGFRLLTLWDGLYLLVGTLSRSTEWTLSCLRLAILCICPY